MKTIQNIPVQSLEIRKLQITFWDRLVVLNAATLALSFTAATAFRGHTVGDGGVGYLFTAWKLLLMSTCWALLAQWLGAASAPHAQAQIVGKLMQYRVVRVRAESVEISDDLEKKLNSMSEGAGKQDTRLWLGAFFFGLAAVIYTLLSMGFLYRFAQVNLAVFLRA